MQSLQESDRVRRDNNVIKSRNDYLIKTKSTNDAYNVTTQLLKSKELTHQSIEDNEDPNEYLKMMLNKREKEITLKTVKRERKFEHARKSELHRLQEILDSDKDGRELARRPNSSIVKFSDF